MEEVVVQDKHLEDDQIEVFILRQKKLCNERLTSVFIEDVESNTIGFYLIKSNFVVVNRLTYCSSIFAQILRQCKTAC